MLFGIQVYHEEMQVRFEYGCDPIIIEGVIALGLRKLLENEFLFIFSLMVSWGGNLGKFPRSQTGS
jgi:hypothetical protein